MQNHVILQWDNDTEGREGEGIAWVNTFALPKLIYFLSPKIYLSKMALN